MARDGMTTFSDIAGKLEMLRVGCEKRGLPGRYAAPSMIQLRCWLNTQRDRFSVSHLNLVAFFNDFELIGVIHI